MTTRPGFRDLRRRSLKRFSMPDLLRKQAFLHDALATEHDPDTHAILERRLVDVGQAIRDLEATNQTKGHLT